jgi:hypothetical protein
MHTNFWVDGTVCFIFFLPQAYFGISKEVFTMKLLFSLLDDSVCTIKKLFGLKNTIFAKKIFSEHLVFYHLTS